MSSSRKSQENPSDRSEEEENPSEEEKPEPEEETPRPAARPAPRVSLSARQRINVPRVSPKTVVPSAEEDKTPVAPVVIGRTSRESSKPIPAPVGTPQKALKPTERKISPIGKPSLSPSERKATLPPVAGRRSLTPPARRSPVPARGIPSGEAKMEEEEFPSEFEPMIAKRVGYAKDLDDVLGFIARDAVHALEQAIELGNEEAVLNLFRIFRFEDFPDGKAVIDGALQFNDLKLKNPFIRRMLGLSYTLGDSGRTPSNTYTSQRAEGPLKPLKPGLGPFMYAPSKRRI